MGIWLNYTNIVKRNCTNEKDTQQDLMYWRNNLFASSLIYLLPLWSYFLMFINLIIKSQEQLFGGNQ